MNDMTFESWGGGVGLPLFLIYQDMVHYLRLLSVSVMPSLDTLKCTMVVLGEGGFMARTSDTHLFTASGPVRDSVSRLWMYSTLHAVKNPDTLRKTYMYTYI